jgi:hypothetical protein
LKEKYQVQVNRAEGIRKVTDSLFAEGGETTANLRVAEQYIEEFGRLAKENNTMIIPQNQSDLAGMVATSMAVLKKRGEATQKLEG